MNSALASLRIVPVLILATGVLSALLCWPLMQGKVKPNRFYGIRTSLAFKSEENWYRMNRFGGRLMFRAGIFIVFVGAAGFAVPVNGLIVYSSIATALVMIAVGGASIRILLGPPNKE